ncbi:unnamed protein product [Rotaria sp. Silwood2]|nr:unnamed protein product [Rotaria sp. Silwood2]CAF2502618.1 unnamed protein product [Rotaria sp. Silwood2]CAF4449943.1 unnamed protein product [Rotaria sp. Silwood2]
MGPFPTTSRQKRFLLVVVDYFTRWVELFPVHTTTSINIAQILINEVFTRYGMPVYVLSDNGPQFISYLFRNFCETLGIQQKFTANYHPQTNLTERINRTLKPMLAIFAESQPRSWDKEVSKLAFALRTAVNETTGETPAFLMFGRDPKIPLDLIVGEPTEGPPTTTIESIQINEYRNNLIHNLRCTYDLVREHSEVKKISQKTKYDKHTSLRQLNVGDLVWVANVTPQIGGMSINRKLQPKYQGPCRLIEQLGPSTFMVQRISDGVNLGVTNVDRMKRYFEPMSNEQPSTSASDTSETEQESTESGQSHTTQKQADRKRTSSRQRKLPVRYSINSY